MSKRSGLSVRLVAMCLSVFAFFVAPAISQASPTEAQVPLTTGLPVADGVTKSPDGWFHYHKNPAIESRHVQSETQARIKGTHIRGGGCRFTGTTTVSKTVTEMVEVETAYNPETCESMVTRAVLGKTLAPKSVTPNARPNLQVAPTGSGSIQYKSGHTKTIWVDPLGINITSLTDDISWPLNNTLGTIKSTVYSYEFKFDAWSNSGIKGPYLTKSEGYYPKESTEPKEKAITNSDWYSSAHETFNNNDFQALLSTTGVGTIGCSEKFVTTEFYHNNKVFGYASGDMGAWWEYQKKGGCSNLVHSTTYYGWGWDGPEKEYVKSPIKYVAIIASTENEAENKAEVSESVGLPGVETFSATPVGSTQATLNGEVNPEGSETHYYYEYGPSESYGHSTPQQSAGSGGAGVNVSAVVSGLEPGTTYHYRVVAYNSSGTSYGPDQIVQTSNVTTAEAIMTKPGEFLVLAEDTNREFINFGRTSEGAWSVFNVTSVVPGNPDIIGTPTVKEPKPGELLVFAEDTNREFICFGRTSAGAWSVFNVTSVVPGNPDIIGAPTVVEPKPGEFLAFAADTNHEFVVFARTTAGAWSVFNVTSVVPGHPGITGAPAVLEPKPGEYAVFAADTNHELVEFARTTAGAWSVFNVTSVAPGNPDIVGTPTVKEPAPGELLVFAEDTNQEFIDFGRTSLGAWSVFNVTSVVPGNPGIIGTPAVLEPKKGEYAVFGVDNNNEMVYFGRTSAGAWSVFNITSVVPGNPDVLAGTPSVLEPAPSEFIAFTADTNHEMISFSRNAAGAWSVYNETAVVPGNPDVE